MRVYCLSGNPNKPCFLAHMSKISVLLDCALDLNPLLQYLPVPLVHSDRLSNLPQWKPDGCDEPVPCLRDCAGQAFVTGTPDVLPPDRDLINVSQIDAILISNYTNMLALPFFISATGFKGTIYATDPTVTLGRLLMEELVEYFERIQAEPSDSNWKKPDIIDAIPSASSWQELCGHPDSWRTMFSKKLLNETLSKITLVAYKERVDLFGVARVIPVSSGYCIGSCNWLIETDYEKIVYISGSSSFTTHPKVMDQSLLKGAHTMILAGLTQTPFHPDTMLGEFCAAVVNTIRDGGNVLVPCYPSGITYDLFECLSTHLDQAACSNVPMFFISPAAESSLAFSNIFAEWLSDAKQAKVYLPEEPFPHALLVKNGRLRYYPAIYKGFSEDFRTPCIVFSGHPSLRIGDAVHFMELWGSDSKNAVIFTEPDFAIPETIAAYQPLAMKAFFCPIDTSLDFVQANKLLRETRPKRLYSSDRYSRPPPGFPGRTDLFLSYEHFYRMKRGQIFAVPMERKYEKLRIEPSLAANVEFEEVSNNVSVSSLLGILSTHDNRLMLRSPASTKDVEVMESVYASPYGKCDIEALIKQLRKAGLESKCERVSSTENRITLVKEPLVSIIVLPNATNISCEEGGEKVRKKLIEIVMNCLSKM